MGLVAIDNGTRSSARIDSGRYTESRWSLRGTETLGGGWAAIFYLESGYSADTATLNQGGRLFGRGAYAGLRSDRWVRSPWAASTCRCSGHCCSQTTPVAYVCIRLAQRRRSTWQRCAHSPVGFASQRRRFSRHLLRRHLHGRCYQQLRGQPGRLPNRVVRRRHRHASYGTGAETASTNSIVRNDQRVLGSNVEWRPPAIKDLYLGAAWNEKSGQRVIGTALYEQKLTESAFTGQYVFPSGFSMWGNYHPFELISGPQRLKGSDYMVGLSYRMPSGLLWGNRSPSALATAGLRRQGLRHRLPAPLVETHRAVWLLRPDRQRCEFGDRHWRR